MIHPRVVEKIVRQAASDVTAVSGTTRHLLGIGLDTTHPRVTATVDGSLARLRIELTLAYPTGLASAASLVREVVARQVRDLAGIDAREVDIMIVGLSTDPARRRVR